LLFIVPTVAEQAQRLSEMIPTGIQRIKEWSADRPWLAQLVRRVERSPQEITAERFAQQVGWIVSSTLHVAASIVLVLFLGVLFALQAKLYLGGIVRLVPLQKRDRAREVIDQVGTALQWWLVARLISMTAIGTLTWVGLLLIGLENAFTLALLAAILTFIPYFGAVLWMVVAMGAGLAVGTQTAMWVFGLYMGVQVLETYFITPMAEFKAASLPPGLTVTTQLTLAILVGPIGFILADPMLAATMVLVRMLYVQDVLGDPEPFDKAPGD
jgi:predicted PurR-regulated permease PerM